MPQAVPTINSVPGSNVNLPINTLVQLNNNNSGGEVSFLWQIVAQPVGTADALSNTIIQNPTFTPRKEGTYLISLTVNGTLTARIVAAVRELKSLTRIPAPQEKTESGISAGWATDTNALLKVLLQSQADPGILVGIAGAAGCNAGMILYSSGSTVIKSGLPGQETLPTYQVTILPNAASNEAQRNGPLYLSLGGVDGNTTPASGALIRVRAYGLYQAAISGAAVGDPLWVDRNGNIQSPSPDRIARRVGTQVSATHIYFDGRYTNQGNVDLYNSLIGDIAVSPANAVRMVYRSNTLQASVNGAAYVPVAIGDAPFLTNGSSPSLSNEVNIQSLTAALNFIAGSTSGKLVIRRFSNVDTGNKLEFQDETSAVVGFVTGDGGISFPSIVCTSLDIAGDVQMAGGEINSAGLIGCASISTSGLATLSSSVLASAATVASPTTNSVRITGTTNIDYIGTVAWTEGSCLRLLFSATLTLNHNSGSPGVNTARLILAGSANLSVDAGDVMSFVLMSNGSVTAWRETSRALA